MKKIGLICLVLVLALGALGVSFAHWSGVLYVQGTATTGTFGAELSLEGCSDNEQTTERPQEIGDCDCYLDDLDPVDGKMDTLVITVTNGYPSYQCIVDFNVHCIGSIPIVVTPGTLTSSDPTVADVTIDIPGGKIHQCESLYGTVTIHFLQSDPPPCPQDGPNSTTFTYTIDYEQAQ